MFQNKDTIHRSSDPSIKNMPEQPTNTNIYFSKVMIGKDSMKKIFDEFVETNPQYIKQVLNKIFKDE